MEILNTASRPAPGKLADAPVRISDRIYNLHDQTNKPQGCRVIEYDARARIYDRIHNSHVRLINRLINHKVVEPQHMA